MDVGTERQRELAAASTGVELRFYRVAVVSGSGSQVASSLGFG